MEAIKSKVRALFLEGLVIVFSILIAFWVDAWWDGYKNRKTEQVYLAGLKEDFAGMRNALAREYERDKMSIDAIHKLTAHQEVNVSRTQLDSLLLQALITPIVNIESGTFKELMASGGLRLIQDQELRIALAKWTLRQKKIEAVHEGLMRIINEFHMPYYMKKTSLIQLQLAYKEAEIRTGDNKPGVLGVRALTSPAMSYDHTSLLEDREFRNILAFRWSHGLSLLTQHIRGVEELDTLIAKIDKLLDK